MKGPWVSGPSNFNDGLEEPSWCQALAPRMDHQGRPYRRGMLGVVEVEDVSCTPIHRRVLLPEEKFIGELGGRPRGEGMVGVDPWKG